MPSLWFSLDMRQQVEFVATKIIQTNIINRDSRNSRGLHNRGMPKAQLKGSALSLPQILRLSRTPSLR